MSADPVYVEHEPGTLSIPTDTVQTGGLQVQAAPVLQNWLQGFVHRRAEQTRLLVRAKRTRKPSVRGADFFCGKGSNGLEINF